MPTEPAVLAHGLPKACGLRACASLSRRIESVVIAKLLPGDFT